MDSITSSYNHNLRLKAVAVDKELRINGPIFRPHHVIMKRDHTTPPYLIFTEEDLLEFENSVRVNQALSSTLVDHVPSDVNQPGDMLTVCAIQDLQVLQQSPIMSPIVPPFISPPDSNSNSISQLLESTPPSINKSLAPKSTSLKIAYVNINRLLKHHPSLLQEINTHNHDIVALSETFLTSHTPTHLYNIPGYTFFHHDRLGKPGGGVAFFCREFFRVEVLHLSRVPYHTAPEFMIVQICIDHQRLLFATVYHPPDTEFPDEFFRRLSPLLPMFDHVVVTGDFIYDMSRNHSDSVKFNDLITAHCLSLVSREPTHHTKRQGNFVHHTCLDLFMTRNPVLTFSKSVSSFTPGHDLIEITYDIATPPISPKTVRTRKLKYLDNSTRTDLIRANLSCLPATSGPANPPTFLPDISLPQYQHLT